MSRHATSGRRVTHSGVFPGVEDAACADRPDVNFFPGSGESPDPALTVCRACQVRPPCLAAALSVPVHDDHGVLGGHTAKERSKMRRTL